MPVPLNQTERPTIEPRRLPTRWLAFVCREDYANILMDFLEASGGEQGGKEEDMLDRLGGNDKAKIFWRNGLS
jgi:hypothetical protein